MSIENNLPKSNITRKLTDTKDEIEFVEAKEIQSKSNSPNNELTAEQKTEITTAVITEGAKLVNRVMDIVEHRIKTDDTLRLMDKQIEFVEKTTEAEVKKMYAVTDNLNRRVKIIEEMLNTLNQNKDLDPQVKDSISDTVITMLEN